MPRTPFVGCAEAAPIDATFSIVHNGHMKAFNCPLCGSMGELFYRHYQHCHQCDLIAVHPDHYLSASDEQAEYDLHQNSPDDLDYRDFLNRLCEPLITLKPAPAQVLDFGSGPGPTLSVMMQEQGYQVNTYDLFYAPDKSVLRNHYEIITMTEVLEHLQKPLEEVQDLTNILAVDGLLGIMTALHAGTDEFPDWHYKNDPTHICFFSQQSIEWLAKACELKVELLTERVMILRKR